MLEHPDRAERAFRSLLLCGIAIRDADEWEEHHMTSVASTGCAGGGSSGDGGDGGNSTVKRRAGSGDRMLDGLAGRDGYRLAEIDGSAVAVVEVNIAVFFLLLGPCFRPSCMACAVGRCKAKDLLVCYCCFFYK